MRWKCLSMAVVLTSGAFAGCGSDAAERSSALEAPLEAVQTETAEVCYVCTDADLAPDDGGLAGDLATEASLLGSPSAGQSLRGTKAVKVACAGLKATRELLQTAIKLLGEFASLAKEIGSAAKVWSVTKNGAAVRVAWGELTRVQKVAQLGELGIKFTLAKVSYDKAVEEYERAKSAKLCDAELEGFKTKADAFLKLVEDLEKKRADEEKAELRLLNMEKFGTPGF